MDATEYAQHLERLYSAGYTALLISHGHHLGLFEIMMKEKRPLTSLELADLAGMKERYIREWLSGAAVGEIIRYDTENATFFIPEEHNFAMTWASTLAEGIAVLANRRKKVHMYFKKDGPNGTTFDDDEHESNFWEMFSEMRIKTNECFVEKYLVPCLKRTTALEKLESGINVLDACCGAGELTIHFAKRFPMSEFTGLDLFEKPLELAKERVSSSGVRNVRLIQSDVPNLSDEMASTYDLVMMFEALHNLPDPPKALSQISKVLKKDGILVLWEHAQSSILEDNIGDVSVSMLATWSINYCLRSSLSTEPEIGYGPCWGMQNITAALRQHFVSDGVFPLPFMHFHLFVFIKKGDLNHLSTLEYPCIICEILVKFEH